MLGRREKGKESLVMREKSKEIEKMCQFNEEKREWKRKSETMYLDLPK